MGTTIGLSKVLVALIKDSWEKQGVCLSDDTARLALLAGARADGLKYLCRGTSEIPGGWRMGWSIES